MVEAVVVPVMLHHRHVEIPARHLGLAFAEGLHSPRTEGNRRQARRTAQPFLRATVDRIDLPGVDVQRNAPQRSHGIRHQQSVKLVAQFAQLFDRLPGAGRGLRMHDGEHLGPNLAEGLANPMQIEHLPPGDFERRDLSAVAAGDFQSDVGRKSR